MTSWDPRTGVGSPQDLQCDQYWVGLGGRVFIEYFPPKARYFLVVSPEDCRGNFVGLDGAQEKSMKQEGRGQSTTLTGGLLESETEPHELSAEFVYRCPGFQHDGPSPALGFVAFRF